MRVSVNRTITRAHTRIRRTGYNRQDNPKSGGSGRFTTYGFAVGSVYRRARDWFDWMLPEAWNVEHNNLHHYRLSEVRACSRDERAAARAAIAPPSHRRRAAIAL